MIYNAKEIEELASIQSLNERMSHPINGGDVDKHKQKYISELSGRSEDGHLLIEMARVGYMTPQYEVYVHTDDPGYIPHVHVRDVGTMGHTFETCVQLKTNAYFLHGRITDEMNSAMRNEFADFMEAPCRNTKYGSNYEFAVDMWNANNSNENIFPETDENGDIKIPDYRTIAPNK